MRALDLGCGWESELWFPGADLCDGVFAEHIEPAIDTEGRVVFAQYIDLENPRLPVQDNTYDFIWCGSLWDFLDDVTKEVIERECYRLLKPGGRFIVRDTNYVEGGTPEWDLSEKEIVKREMSHFPEERWYGMLYFDVDVEVDGAGKCIYYLLHLDKKEEETK